MLTSFVCVLAVFEYVCSGKILAAIGALACGVVMFVVIKLLQKADDDFISEVVAAMSDLLDNLSDLKRQQVFPEMMTRWYQGCRARLTR